jgi:hypothetical protein
MHNPPSTPNIHKRTHTNARAHNRTHTNARTHTHTHTHTRARARAYAHTRTSSRLTLTCSFITLYQIACFSCYLVHRRSYIKDELFGTTPDDVCLAGYDKHLESEAAPAPLSMDEHEKMQLQKVRYRAVFVL